MCQGPGVQVVALVPVAGPVPPPIRVVMPAARASSTCCGQMKWMWLSTPPAVMIFPSPAMISVPGPMMMVTLDWTSGLPALPMAAMRPSRRPISALMMPQWSTISALVMDGVDGALGARQLRLAHAVADDLAAAEFDLVTVGGEILFDFDDQVGVGQADAIARCRARTCRRRRSGEAWPFRQKGQGLCPWTPPEPAALDRIF